MRAKIETDRLILRALEKSDADTVFSLRSSEIVNKYIARPLQEDRSETFAFIDKIEKGLANNEIEFWVIQLKDMTTCIGTICLWNFSEDKRTAEVGYDLLPDFHSRGVMSEALKAVLKFGFTNLKLNTIEAFTHKENTASKMLLEKNKFIFQPRREDPGFPNNIIYKIERQDVC